MEQKEWTLSNGVKVRFVHGLEVKCPKDNDWYRIASDSTDLMVITSIIEGQLAEQKARKGYR